MQYAREAHKLLQSDMVESTGLTKNHISAVERGVSKPSIEMLLGYCKKLETTPNDILGFTDDNILIELKQELSKMTISEQQKILEIVKILKN